MRGWQCDGPCGLFYEDTTRKPRGQFQYTPRSSDDANGRSIRTPELTATFCRDCADGMWDAITGGDTDEQIFDSSPAPDGA